MRGAFASGSDHFCGEGPWIKAALAASIDDAEAGCIESAALVGSGAERDMLLMHIHPVSLSAPQWMGATSGFRPSGGAPRSNVHKQLSSMGGPENTP